MTSTDDIQAREAIPADIMQVARKTVAHEKSLGISNIWTNTVGPLLARIAELEAGLDCLVNAKALSGVRELVAGWNGERRPEGPYTERHPARLGATLPKTNCGAVYALDDAMQTARSLLNKDRQP